MIQKRWGKHQPGASSSSNNIRDTQIEPFFRNHRELRGGRIWKNPGIFREDQLSFLGYMPYLTKSSRPCNQSTTLKVKHDTFCLKETSLKENDGTLVTDVSETPLNCDS